MARISRRCCLIGSICGSIVVNVLLMCLVQTANAQLGQNSPPFMYVERDWRLAEDELNGTVVTRVQAHDDNGDTLHFGLEPHLVIRGPADAIDRLPFRINDRTGVVYLNDSLVGRGGEEFSVYVAVSDGLVELKNEVHVYVGAAGGGAGSIPPGPYGPGSFKPHVRNVTDRFPAFGLLPGVPVAPVYGAGGGGGSLPPSGMFGAATPHRQTHTYPTGGGGGGGRPAHAKPTEISGGHKNDDDNDIDDDGAAAGADDDESQASWPPSSDGADKKQPPDYPAGVYTSSSNRGKNATTSTTTTRLTTAPPSTSAADASSPGGNSSSSSGATGSSDGAADTVRLSLTLVLAICGGVMLAAGFAAVYMCRQNLCAFGRRIKTKSKEEMAKKSNPSGSISGGPMGGGSLGGASSLTGTEDSRNSMVMQNWSGPRAFNNRYVPWQRDGDNNQHVQVSSQLSTSSSTGTAIVKSDRWEFPRHRLKFHNVLGQGAFGLVFRCEATDMDGKDGVSVVAVKTLKENASDIEIKDLNSELQVMKTLEPHVNVVRLLGCCTDDPILVILEYVNRGKLQDYLRNSRAEKHYGNAHGQSDTLTSGDLTSFMYQVARGMEYLSSRGIIHRDLAARNILITDDHTCKVADFGFARDVVTSKVYERKSEGKLPIRWMAIESLYDDIFSVKSDIWSFGILMWEIVTLGSTPYPGMSASDVMRKVRDGYRLQKPEHCRRELYNIMYYCWTEDFNERPVFSDLVERLDKLMVSEMDYIQLECFPDHNYYNMSSLSGEKL